MSEKMYTGLLRLYPSGFRREYGDAALRLIRDRFRDETGFFKRIRLWRDLATDVLVGLPQAYRNSYAETEVVSLSPNAEGIPSFKVLSEVPLRRGSIFVGGIVSLSAIAAFGFVLSQPIAYLPLPGSNARMSPIESVMQRLNRTTDPNSAVDSRLDVAKFLSAGAGDSQAQSSATQAASVSKPNTTASLHESKNATVELDRVAPLQNHSPKDHSKKWGKALAAFESPPQDEKQRNLGANAKVLADELNAEVRNGSRDSHTFTEQGLNSLSPGGATAGCNLVSVSQTAQPEPELLLFHASGPLLSYEVATVKPLAPDVASSVVRLPPGGSLSPLTIRRYIMNAYGAVYPPQIVGGPDWLNKDAYDIKGKVPDELESALQKMTREERIDKTRIMQQCLLADRFHLKAHFETRVLPVYELVPAKGGLKITEVHAPPETKPGDSPMRSRTDDPLPPGSSTTAINSNGLRVLNARAIKMQLLTRIIVGDIGDRPIVDHTGFTGYFDITDLTWAPLGDAGSTSEPDGSSIQGALKEKFGLRVVPTRDPIEVLVVDTIDRPTPN
ncbi:MAG: TIGR03435 family protein [Bryobacteraceae bacterium]|jgi:uncharacterized protein (TIGR03435 family)